MKSKLLLISLSLAGLAYADPFTRQAITTSSGQTMTWGKVYTVDNNITITSMGGRPALAVEPGKKAILEVARGKTLTVNGGDGTYDQPSYPAILVPEGSTLYIVGEGTLDLKGGDASHGQDGGNGGNGRYDKGCYAGKGGKGGNGGSGGSPAIGGRGGVGGAGSEGPDGPAPGNRDLSPCYDGNSATTPGGNGTPGTGMGTVIIAGSVYVKTQAGRGGNGGKGGSEGSLARNGGDKICGGGGGGGGGGGYPAFLTIGGGGAGGGAGGAGGSGGMYWKNEGFPYAGGGKGGSGYETGGTGSQTGGPSKATGCRFGEKTGGSGAGGGSAGSLTVNHGTLKLLAPAALSADRETELLTPSTYTNEFFSVKVTFDWCIASMPAEYANAWFMAAPPAGPVKDRKGYRFLGWWTEKNGGDCYYVPNAKGTSCRPLSTVSSLTRDITLYPRWEPTPDILTVNSTRDSRFDPTKKVQAQGLNEVTLLDALDAFKAYPYLTGTNGYRRIVFNLPENNRVLTISSTISIDDDIEIDGTNEGRGIVIRAGDSFPVGSPLIRLMRRNGYLTNLNLDCANKAGGIECTAATLGLVNCAIENGGVTADGVIRVIDGELIALNTSLYRNMCALGALRPVRSVVTAVNCTFADNESDTGTVSFTGPADAVFANCTFVGEGNTRKHIKIAAGGTVKAVNTLFSPWNLDYGVKHINTLWGDRYFRNVNERIPVEVLGVKHMVAPPAFRQECLEAVEILTDRRFENLVYRKKGDQNIYPLRGSNLNASVPLLIDEVRDLYLTPNVGAIRLLVGDRLPSQMVEGYDAGVSSKTQEKDVYIRYDDNSEETVKGQYLWNRSDGWSLPLEVPLTPPQAEAHKPISIGLVPGATNAKRLGDSPYAFVADSAAALYKADDKTMLDGKEFAIASAVTEGGMIVRNELDVAADTYTAGSVDGFGEITLKGIDATTGGLAWIGEPIKLVPSDDGRNKTVTAPFDGLLQIEGKNFTASQEVSVQLETNSESVLITPVGTVTDAYSGHALIENPIWTIPVAKGDILHFNYDSGKPEVNIRLYPFGITGNKRNN